VARVAVIGAGVAGLLGASRLAERHEVVVVDREPAVGGRLSTAVTADDVRFDEGAQFFTARKPEFSAVVDDLRRLGLVRVWHERFLEVGGGSREDGYPRFCGAHGMADLARGLERGLDVRCGTRVQRLERRRGLWHVVLHDQETIGADAVLLTPPAPVALTLVRPDDLPDAVMQRVAGVAYDRCLAVLAELGGPSGLAPPGALRLGPEPVEWVADNEQKGIATRPALTVHVGPATSTAWWADPDDVIAERVAEVVGPHLAAPFLRASVRRWPHSRPRTTLPERFVAVGDPAPLVFAGDAYGGPLVEGAALSGLAAAAHLLAALG
jgi:renalase